MAHNATIKGLKSLTKVNPATLAPEDLVKHVNRESDRSVIILMGSILDDILGALMKQKFEPNLKAEDLENIFSFNGVLGSFSSRIDLAVAMGMVPRAYHSKFITLKVIRNTAAHSVAPITFEVPEIRAAVRSLVDGKFHKLIEAWDALAIRKLFIVMACNFIAIASDINFANEDQESVFVRAVSREFEERRKASA